MAIIDISDGYDLDLDPNVETAYEDTFYGFDCD